MRAADEGCVVTNDAPALTPRPLRVTTLLRARDENGRLPLMNQLFVFGHPSQVWKLRGAIPVMAAPYREDEIIDEEGLRGQVDFAISKGAAAVCVPGFGTEFYKLSDPERYRVAEVVLEHTAKRKPVIISTGSGSIFTTIQFSGYAESKGADCLMVLLPRITPSAET
jgi:hypothetical protein